MVNDDSKPNVAPVQPEKPHHVPVANPTTHSKIMPKPD